MLSSRVRVYNNEQLLNELDEAVRSVGYDKDITLHVRKRSPGISDIVVEKEETANESTRKNGG